LGKIQLLYVITRLASPVLAAAPCLGSHRDFVAVSDSAEWI
jgi:hypothetical protein